MPPKKNGKRKIDSDNDDATGNKRLHSSFDVFERDCDFFPDDNLEKLKKWRDQGFGDEEQFLVVPIRDAQRKHKASKNGWVPNLSAFDEIAEVALKAVESLKDIKVEKKNGKGLEEKFTLLDITAFMDDLKLRPRIMVEDCDNTPIDCVDAMKSGWKYNEDNSEGFLVGKSGKFVATLSVNVPYSMNDDIKEGFGMSKPYKEVYARHVGEVRVKIDMSLKEPESSETEFQNVRLEGGVRVGCIGKLMMEEEAEMRPVFVVASNNGGEDAEIELENFAILGIDFDKFDSEDHCV